jgi:hypothetical protein
MGFDTVLTQFGRILHQQRTVRRDVVRASGLESEKPCSGRLAQLVRAPALQAGGRRFESCTAHQRFHNYLRLRSGLCGRICVVVCVDSRKVIILSNAQ